jgi:hypothetical protein
MGLKIMKKIIIFISGLLFCSISSAQDMNTDDYISKKNENFYKDVGFQDFHWIRWNLNQQDGSYSCPSFDATNLNKQDGSLQDPYYFYSSTEDKNNFKNNYSAKNSNFCRELMVRVYFPIKDHADKKPANIDQIVVDDLNLNKLQPINQYLSLALQSKFKKDLAQFQNTPTSNYDFNQINLSEVNLPFSNKNKLPVIFFYPGMGSVFQEYDNLISEIVRHGYIVVGTNFTFINNAGSPAHEIIFPATKNSPQRIVPYDENSQTIVENINSTYNEQLGHNNLMVSDVLFTLNRSNQLSADSNNTLFSSMDLSRVALLGHSGGANAVVMVA